MNEPTGTLYSPPRNYNFLLFTKCWCGSIIWFWQDLPGHILGDNNTKHGKAAIEFMRKIARSEVKPDE